MINLAKAVAIVVSLSAASPLMAEQVYAAYEGPPAVKMGTGGTKITANGIDYWTSGSPPRRYQLLGILTDARKDGMFDGKVLGSKSVAKRTLEVGGNAVIFGGQDAQVSGGSAVVNGDFVISDVTTRTTTQLLVVKYLED